MNLDIVVWKVAFRWHKEFILENSEQLHETFCSRYLLIIEIGMQNHSNSSQDVNYGIFLPEKSLVSPHSLILPLQWSFIFVITYVFHMQAVCSLLFSGCCSPSFECRGLNQGEVNLFLHVIKQMWDISFMAKNWWWQRCCFFQHTEIATREIHSALKIPYSLPIAVKESTPKGSQPRDTV